MWVCLDGLEVGGENIMSKLLLFSDLHADNWSAFSYTTEEGYNSRLISQINVLHTILSYAQENDCKVVFAGDLFNRRLLIPSDVVHLVSEVFLNYKVITYLVVGNHDMYSNKPWHTLLGLFNHIPHVFVITERTNIYVQPHIHISMVPYGESIIEASRSNLPKQAYHMLVAHYGINEAKLGPSNYRMESDLTVKQIKEYGYDLALFGHVHKDQALTDNIIVLGSCMAHSFHEAWEEKFFYVFDCVERTLVKYPTNAPKFMVHEINSEEELKSVDIRDGNYHRINILTPKITMEDVKAYTDTNVIISFNAQSQYRYEGKIEESKNRTPKQEVEDYYSVLETELEKDKLKERAYKIIEGG